MCRPFLGGMKWRKTANKLHTISHKFNKENIILKRFGKSTREREKEREQYCDLY